MLFSKTHYDGIVNFLHYADAEEYKRVHPFLMKNTDKPYIHIYSMGDKWRYVETIPEGTVELDTGVGIKVSRYAYRTTPRAAATDVQCCVYSTIQNT